MFAANLNRIASFGRYTEETRDRLLLSSLYNYRCDFDVVIFRQDVCYSDIPQWSLKKNLCIKLVIDHAERSGHVELGIDLGDGYERVLTVPEIDSLPEWIETACKDREAYKASQGVSRFFYEAVRQHPDAFNLLIQIATRVDWALSLSHQEIHRQWVQTE